MGATPNKSIFYSFFLFFTGLLILGLAGCQEDPILQPLENGVPVITPKTKASITVIQINTHPEFDPASALWDNIDSTTFDTLGRPDIFFNITAPGTTTPILWSQNSHFLNCGPNDTIPYYLLSPYAVEPFGSTITVNLYDYELPDSTFMESLDFFIGEYPDPANPYPSSITQTKNGYSVSVGIKWED
ncbi:MAG: hypothetical protein ACKOGP_09490 [Bacteroidota bacterium]